MTNLIVPGQQQPPTYPQVNATPTPQGVAFNVQLGSNIAITLFISHSDMEQIEAMRKAKLREFRQMDDIAQSVIKNRL